MTTTDTFGRRKVLVLGGGIAGTAAAYRAAEHGASVFLVSAGAGASVLSSGALDDLPWEDLARAESIARRALAVSRNDAASDKEPEGPASALSAGADTPAPWLRARPLRPGVDAFAAALGTWRIPSPGAPLPRLATLAGRTRPARGHDLATLDLATLQTGTIAVPRVDRAAWDADSLASFWSADPFARSHGLRFVPVDASLLRFDGEDRIADADLASRHDDPARVGWLAERLREAFSRARLTPTAVILGPWLGIDSPRAQALSDRLGIPCGEALASTGSPAGLRFARARDRLLAKSGVRVILARVTKIEPPARPEALALPDSARSNPPESVRERVPESVRLAEQRATITLDSDDSPLRADRVILACGGLAGGGLVYDPPDIHAGADMPERSHAAFRFSFEVIPTSDGRPSLVSAGARAALPASMFGPTLDLTAWPTPGQTGALESIGVAVTPGDLAAPYLAAAGEVIEGRPRTALLAVETGLSAGDWSAG